MTTSTSQLLREIAQAEEFLRDLGHTLSCGEQDLAYDVLAAMKRELAEAEPSACATPSSEIRACYDCPADAPYPGTDLTHAQAIAHARLENAAECLRQATEWIEDAAPGNLTPAENAWEDAQFEWEEAKGFAREHGLDDVVDENIAHLKSQGVS